jgi:hypothetical protein
VKFTVLSIGLLAVAQAPIAVSEPFSLVCSGLALLLLARAVRRRSSRRAVPLTEQTQWSSPMTLPSDVLSSKA